MSDSLEMTFFEHLAELRRRLVYVALALLAASAVSLGWATEVFSFFTLPIRSSFPSAQLIGTAPAEALLIKLEVAFTTGVFLSLPITFYQLWRFVAPGLHRHERRLALPFICFATLFFLIGAAFCFWVVLPIALKFFGDEFASIGLLPQIRIREYLSFSMQLVVVFGIVFDLPVVAYVLTRAGILTSQFLMRNLRMAIVVVFIAAGVLTPPDVVSQALLAGPLLVLYALCIWVSRWAEKPGAASVEQPSS